ncbi:hypothetical protein [Actinomycetospora straminea]|uniref:Uncharacterized protein n=1 Tax=Actinomycetospora straminea TaxID=663607 RepID=A0ABP9F308_9PSEU|nr:hypothetical protein [Actinomycetospora straminea]MDD7934727.1 hypothetical protein [Actinomycetospora straminea]
MTVEAPTRPVTTVPQPPHVHDRTCFWDVLACRWAGPAHPAPPAPQVPAPRRSPED